MPIRIHTNGPNAAIEGIEGLKQIATLNCPWIDLLQPTQDEFIAVQKALGFELPTREEMREIEATSRFYYEDGARVMTAPLLVNTDSESPVSTEVSFILHRDRLITIRDQPSRSFSQTEQWLAKRPIVSRDQIFIALLEAIVDRQADFLETISRETEEMSLKIFTPSKRVKESENKLRNAIYRLGRSGNLISRERDSIIGLSRLVQYAGHEDFGDDITEHPSQLFPRLKPIAKDLQSLSEFAGFLTNKVNFMLDATLGLISIEQNAIVKIFTVSAVIFLPPTLVASVYGMNFKFLPELEWKYGYAFAILLMLISVMLPYLYCRRKGWL